MREYSFGVETVPVSISGDAVIGSVHDGGHYRILVARIKNDGVAKSVFMGGANDWEGRVPVVMIISEHGSP